MKPLQIITNNKHETVPGVQDILYYQNNYELASFERQNINMHDVNSVSVTLHVLLAAVNKWQWYTSFRTIGSDTMFR